MSSALSPQEEQTPLVSRETEEEHRQESTTCSATADGRTRARVSDLEEAIRASAGVDRSTDRRSDSLSHPGSRSGLTTGSRRGLCLTGTSHPGSFVETADTTPSDKQRAGSVGPPRTAEAAADIGEAAKGQFFLAASRPPKRFVSRLQRAINQGPHARHETEDAERVRWVKHLADLLPESPTPVGEALRSKPGDTSLPGAGRTVSTLRGQVRAVRRFLKWLWENHSVTFPTALEQLLEYLQVRLREPCNRVSLRNAHEAMAFLEEAAAIKAEKRLTSMSLYAVGYKELLSVRRNDCEGRRGRVSSDLLLVDSGPDSVHAPFQRPQGRLATRSQCGRIGSRCNPEEVENYRKRQVRRIDHWFLMDRASSRNATVC